MDLPELPEATLRLQRLRWEDLIEKRGFTGDHFKWHKSPERRHRAAAPGFSLAPPPPAAVSDRSPHFRTMHYGAGGKPISYDEWRQEQLAAWAARENEPCVIDKIGICETVSLAKERFDHILSDYMPLWDRAEGHTEEFVQWLEAIKSLVTNEVRDVWHSEWHTPWFDRACGEKVNETLKGAVKEWASKVRTLEMRRLESKAHPVKHLEPLSPGRPVDGKSIGEAALGSTGEGAGGSAKQQPRPREPVLTDTPRPAAPESKSEVGSLKPLAVEAVTNPVRRGRPRKSQNAHPEVDHRLIDISKYAQGIGNPFPQLRRGITLTDFANVSGYADDTILSYYRQGSPRCSEAQAARFERTLSLTPAQFIEELARGKGISNS